MPNKRISELPSITTNEISGNTLIPLVTYYSAATGDTVHTIVDDFVSYTLSATPITYSNLYTLYSSSGLTVGSWYEITDFETIYDQPNYYVDNAQKTTIVTTGSSTDYGYQPILVFATSNHSLSPDAYQPFYPKDKIKYDITFTQTEVNSGTTKGRISERIDEYNNRTDYDHRTVKYIRYQNYENPSGLTGTIEAFDSVTGILSGNATSFSTQISVGDIIKIQTFSNYGFYLSVKVTGITSNTEIQVYTDPNLAPLNFTSQSYSFSKVLPSGKYNMYREFYIGQELNGDFDFFNTFQFDEEITTYGYVSSVNNYIGNFSNTNQTFILSNNVFGMLTTENTAINFFNNSFLEGCNYNSFNASTYGNICDQYFTTNTINDAFRFNIVGSTFQRNAINNAVNAYDFTNSNHVYGAYNTTIFQNSSLTSRLSFFDSIDNIIITDITT